MNKTAKRVFGSALAALTVLSTVLTSACMVGASTAEAKDPKDIDRVVVDCRTAESFAKTSYVYVHKPTASEPDPFTGGLYSFHEGMNAMSVDYNAGAPKNREYRILAHFNQKCTVTEDYKYLVIVYAAKTTQDYRLSVWNGAGSGPEKIVVSNGKDTKAKFVVTEPVDISVKGSNGQSTLNRWVNGSHSTIAFLTSEKNANFFIKEYAFFKSPEDAKAYYAGVDLNKDPLEYGENAVKPTTETAKEAAEVPDASKVVEKTTEDVEVAPVYISFESADALSRNAAMRVFTGENEGLGGIQEFKTIDGTGCVQILAHKYTGKASAGSSDYRMMLHFKEKNLVSENHKYVRITYMTTNKEAGKLTITNNASGKTVELASNTSVSKGKFVTSDPVEISSTGMISRFNIGNHCSIEYKTSAKEPVIYIKEIIFFGTEAQAKAYDPSKPFDLSTEYKPVADAPATPTTPAAPTTPADPDNNVFNVTYTVVDEPKIDTSAATVEPVIVDFSTRSNMNKNMWFRAFDGELSGLGGKQQFVTLDDGTQCMQLLYHEYKGKSSAGSSSHYRMMPYFTVPGIVTEAHKYVRVTYMTTDIAPRTLTLTNNASGVAVTLAPNTALSQGKFVRTAPVEISSAGLTKRYADGSHCAFQYTSTLEDSKIYIKEIAFFATPEQAYEYYGDSIDVTQIQYVELSMNIGGTGIAVHKDTWGNSVDTADGVEIGYIQSGEWSGVHYRTDIKAATNGYLTNAGPYIRVLYSAQNPSDVKKASMWIQNNKTGHRFLLSDNVVNTNGEFVLSDVALVNQETFDRFSGVQNAIVLNANSEGGKYTIKTVYFFKNRAEAEAFTFSSEPSVIEINGNNISEYQIVVSEDAPDNIKTYAKTMVSAINRIAQVELPIVDDTAAVSPYEILVGKSSRPLSTFNMDKIVAAAENAYGIFVEGDTLIITANTGLNTMTAMEVANTSLFYNGVVGAPKNIVINSDINMIDIDKAFKVVTMWSEGEPVPDPEVVKVDFTENEGYFTEDNGERNWTLENGVYKTNATEFASSYIHTYEKNVVYKAKLTYTEANKGSMGLMARVNDVYAYVKAGYDFENGVWYIESRDGRDNYLERNAEKAAAIAPNTVYELVFTTEGDYASLSVNGEAVIVNAKVNHVSPGRLAVYAENASVSVDDIEITMVSGMGTVIKNVAHTKIPYDSYMEGATVHKRADGSLYLVHPYAKSSPVTYKSLDGGYSWQLTDPWSDNADYSYSSMIRLNDGSFVRIASSTINGQAYKTSQISFDDGETWSEHYPICYGSYKFTTHAKGSNMNDKITQAPATGKWANRIFFVQTFEVNTAWSDGSPVEGRLIFCEFFYSDDGGKTWTKSETDSWEIEGIENELRYSECKIIICDDGTVRMYNSWSNLGYITYSDSHDGGKTFGPIQYMYDFACYQSSMQLVRDPYGETDYTYYMVWPNGDFSSGTWNASRYRLSLAKSTNGKDWVYLGDVWRWESTMSHGSTLLHHIVDPFVYTTEDAVICGSGFSDSRKLIGTGEGGPDGHQGQRQHIYTIKKDTLPEGKAMNVYTDIEEGAPYFAAVSYVTDNGYMAGTDETAFSPNEPVTGAIYKQYFAKLANADSAVHTDGIDDAANVTVQQAIASLASLASFKNTANGTGKTSANYVDAAAVAPWATQAVDWAVANGIYNGQAGKLEPNAPVTRAVLATMFYNYAQAFGN